LEIAPDRRHNSPICVLPPEAAVAKQHLILIDIVTEAEPPLAEPVLPFVSPDASELLDGVSSGSVERVFTESGEGCSIDIRELGVALRKLSGKAIKTRRVERRKGDAMDG
jgi:hypothetical protein